jgi:hypothetical protein
VKHLSPGDADGDALRKVAESGADMSRPTVIEFSVDVPDERAARRVAEVVAPSVGGLAGAPHVRLDIVARQSGRESASIRMRRSWQVDFRGF